MSTHRLQLTSAARRPVIAELAAAKWRWIGFWAAHVPLGVLAFQIPSVGTIHSALTIAIGLYLAAFGKRIKYVAYAAGYIVGAEVLWRMTRSQLFWEGGKYAIGLFCIISLIRLRSVKTPKSAVLYFVLLLPSTLPLFIEMSFAAARQQISFNLSGPLTLMLCVWFFNHVRLNSDQLQRLFMVSAAPVISIAMLTLFNISTNEDLVFTGESNRDVTGGFGPNQVSAALGLGALLLIFCLLHEKKSKLLRLTMLSAILFFIVQAALTFSRGGLYNAFGAAALASVFLLNNKRARINLIIFGAVFILFAQFVLLPKLDTFTEGALEARFQNVDATGRGELLQADLNIWAENPILGVGPGQAQELREELTLVAHTEFSRLLSEHGIFGFAALISLLAAGFFAFKRARGAQSKAVVVAMVSWSFLFMLNAAMRTAAPSFIFGLAYATFLLDDKKSKLALAKRERRNAAQPAFW